jgi:hypothetical protein
MRRTVVHAAVADYPTFGPWNDHDPGGRLRVAATIGVRRLDCAVILARAGDFAAGLDLLAARLRISGLFRLSILY